MQYFRMVDSQHTHLFLLQIRIYLQLLRKFAFLQLFICSNLQEIFLELNVHLKTTSIS